MKQLKRHLAIEGGEPVRTQVWPPHLSIDANDERLLLTALQSGIWSSGPMTAAFEAEFAQFCGAKHCMLVTNGTTALKLALQASGIGPGDEVIIPGMTWPSVAVAVFELGAVPVPVDIALETFAISPTALQGALTLRTRAIVPTHLFSSQADLEPILSIATAHRLIVVEDCSHATGAQRFGRVLGTFGHAGIFSFNQKKLLACGEGGCLITDDTQLFERALTLRQITPDTRFSTFLPGTHLASEFQAAVLISQLRKLPERLALMEERGERLRFLLERSAGVVPLLRLPDTDRQTFYNFCFRVQGVEDISWFRRALAAELNLSMTGAYQPLTEAPVLNTTNEPRFGALGGFLRAELQHCRVAHYREAIRFHWGALFGGEAAMDDIARAVEKVREAM